MLETGITSGSLVTNSIFTLKIQCHPVITGIEMLSETSDINSNLALLAAKENFTASTRRERFNS
jgi:hypothetical protein